jgi:hypothetical protein
MHLNTEAIKEIAMMWENMEPGADHEREDLVEELASMVSSMKAPLAQRTVRMGSVQKISSHPL